MTRLLRAFPLVVLLLAAFDTFLARRSVPHRPVEVGLLLEAGLLWGVFALVALIPAWLTLLVAGRRRGDGEEPPRGALLRAGAVHLFWTALPVVLHAALDRFTGEGQDISKLKSVVPWLVVLGVGVAFAIAVRIVAGALGRLPGKAVGALAVLPGVLALFLPLQRTLPPLEGAPDASGKPNLLLLVWDTARADATGPYGYERETTPHLARFAEEALVFEEARSATIFTFTSHLTMLTGVMPSVHGARLLRTRYDPRKATTIAELLRNEGYRTGAFVGTDVLAGRTGMLHGFETYRDGVDPPVCDTQAWKLVHDVQSVLALNFRAFRGNGQPHWIQDFQRPAPQVLEQAVDWIDNGDPRPWFCMINLYDVHWPYLPGQDARDEMVRSYNGALDGYLFRSDAFTKGTELGPDDVRHVRDLYDAELVQLDRDVHEFLGRIDLDSTGVLVTSDHGEAFGEAGAWKHEDVFEPQLSIPFILRLPGGTRSGLVPTRAAGVDVAPTLLGMAGVAIPEYVQGVDLVSVVPEPDRLIMVEDSDHIDPTFIRLALYRGRFKIVRRGKFPEFYYTLHDVQEDPVGAVDVSARYPKVREELVAKMIELRGGIDAELASEKVDLGAAADGLKALGYVDD